MIMKKHVFPIILVAISLISWMFNFSSLPEEIPVHWGKDGVDGYQSKGSAFIVLHAIMIGTYILMMVVPKIDPKKKNYNYFTKGYMIINYALITLLFLINMGILLLCLGVNIPMERLAGPFVGGIFMILGNYIQQARTNYFIGIRTPWTLSNEEVWRKTHRLGGKLFMGGGLLIFLTFFMPMEWEFYIIMGVVAVITIVPTVYSYFVFKSITKEA
jgi:uncharacterized membrane protein